MISGTVRLIVNGNLVTSRRYSNKHLIKFYIQKWKQLYALHRKNYEISILPDLPEVNEIKFDSYIEKINKMSQKKEEPKKQNQVVLAALDKLPAIKIADDPRVHKKFVNLYNQIHGNASGELMYNTEKFHFAKLLQENANLRKCTHLSIYGAFLDVAVQGLSVDPIKKLCYIVPYGDKATLQISGYGELLLRQRYGQIKYADNPVVVYEGDHFKVNTKEGKITIDYSPKIPRASNNVVASFIRIVRMDGEVEFKYYTVDDIERFRSASRAPNSSAWKDNYAGMVEAKTIKHAFKTYPKLMLKGQFSQLETETDDTQDIDYGLVDEETGDVMEIKQSKKEEKEVFGDPVNEEKESTVTANSDEYDGY